MNKGSKHALKKTSKYCLGCYNPRDFCTCLPDGKTCMDCMRNHQCRRKAVTACWFQPSGFVEVTK